MLRWLPENITTRFDEVVINFEFINKRLFSAAGRVLKPDSRRFTRERFELLMFINCNKDFKH